MAKQRRRASAVISGETWDAPAVAGVACKYPGCEEWASYQSTISDEPVCRKHVGEYSYLVRPLEVMG